jgi:sulfite reductase (ferredoxin)
VSEFEARFLATELFFDKYAKGKFGAYLMARHAHQPSDSGHPGKVERDQAAARVEESLLFIEASHACEARVSAAGVAVS